MILKTGSAMLLMIHLEYSIVISYISARKAIANPIANDSENTARHSSARVI